MTVKGINKTAEFFIQTLELQPKDQEKVRICVLDYTKPSGCLSSLRAFAMRIWHAIKAIFGYSSWQIAREAIQSKWENKALEIAKEFRLNERGKHVLVNRPSTSLSVADGCLDDCIKYNEGADAQPGDHWSISIDDLRLRAGILSSESNYRFVQSPEMRRV